MSTEGIPRLGGDKEEIMKTMPKSNVQLMKIVKRPLIKFLRERMCLGEHSRQCFNPHSFDVLQQFLTHNMVLVPHPPYSPNLAPSDIFCFNRRRKV
ncbi:hypothetical protein TNCV_3192961 [Trichonephila clavipes]|nr:hypothetical protein TNCV_3192961 [Trichonephila clavipes]